MHMELIQHKNSYNYTQEYSKPAFLNPNHSATRFLPQPLIFGSRKKSNPVW